MIILFIPLGPNDVFTMFDRSCRSDPGFRSASGDRTPNLPVPRFPGGRCCNHNRSSSSTSRTSRPPSIRIHQSIQTHNSRDVVNTRRRGVCVAAQVEGGGRGHLCTEYIAHHPSHTHTHISPRHTAKVNLSGMAGLFSVWRMWIGREGGNRGFGGRLCSPVSRF